MEYLTSFFGTASFLPHGYCFTWTPLLLWSMVGADGLIAAAYFSIPAAILRFVRRRRDAAIQPVAWMFSAFIFSCGLTHLMDIWTIWEPVYGLQALIKTVTAAISVITAIALWRLIPKALKLPSVQQLQSVIASLEAEVERRREAENKVVDVQQGLAVALASIGAGFIATDAQGRIKRMNAVAEQLTGWPERQAQGQDLWDVFVREDRPEAYASMNPVTVMQSEGITIDTVHRVMVISRDGRRTPFDVQAALTRAADDTVLGVALVFRDATQLVRAETESNRLAAIVASSNDAIIGKTMDGRITSWNRAAEMMFGYPAEEAIGSQVQMLIPPDREAEEMRIIANLSSGLQMPAFDTVRRHRNGSLLEVSITISPIRNGQGRIIGASKIARDVSAQRRMEAALRDGEARLRFILEAAQIGDWDLDLSTGEMERSLRHDRCFGFQAKQAEWSFERFIAQVHPDDRRMVADALQVALKSLQDWRFQCRVVWPDGSIHWISAHGSVPGTRGAATHMLGIVTDITAQRQAEEARLQSQRLEAENRQIQEASRLKSQFLANMSHELRTPLNAIIGFSDVLRSGAVPVELPQHLEFLGHIGTSGRHLLQLINDVLDLSKVESGKFEFYPEPVQLPLVVQEVQDVLHTAILSKRIQLVCEIDAALTDIVIDESRLKQVLYNYLSNAIKFTAQGGRVNLRATPEGTERFRIEVEDNGIGIAEEDIPRLFSEFQQLDDSYGKQHQGTGLGLALTRRLVEAQGGEVGVRSVVGQGSVFHLVLDRLHHKDVAPGLSAGAGLSAAAVSRRVLMIGAGRDESRSLSQAMAETGVAVDAVMTGEEAIVQAGNTAYDAITLNLVLPDQHGLNALAHIRLRGASHAARVSGLSMPTGGEQLASFAIGDVLSKPMRNQEVTAALSRFRRVDSVRGRILVVDDDPLALELMGAMLKNMGLDSHGLLDAREALRIMDQYQPDAIILDLLMPDLNGFEFLDELQRMRPSQSIPVFVWTSMSLSDDEYAMLADSARAILRKGGGATSEMMQGLRRLLLAEIDTMNMATA